MKLSHYWVTHSRYLSSYFEYHNFGKIGLLKTVSKWEISQGRDQYFRKILVLVRVLTVLNLNVSL